MCPPLYSVESHFPTDLNCVLAFLGHRSSSSSSSSSIIHSLHGNDEVCIHVILNFFFLLLLLLLMMMMIVLPGFIHIHTCIRAAGISSVEQHPAAAKKLREGINQLMGKWVDG